jgi:hypothetical protein
MTDPVQTLPIYTSLFNKLGMGAVSAPSSPCWRCR